MAQYPCRGIPCGGVFGAIGGTFMAGGVPPIGGAPIGDAPIGGAPCGGRLGCSGIEGGGAPCGSGAPIGIPPPDGIPCGSGAPTGGEPGGGICGICICGGGRAIFISALEMLLR
jgi:hypothetical protein